MKRRRHRQPSLDAGIRIAARQIMQTQMAEAYKAAALGIVARKLDEIRAILSAAGVGISDARVAGIGVPAPPVSAPPRVEHPCFQCGREGVRRSRPNKFDPAGRWACAAHVPLLGLQAQEDALDGALIRSAEGPSPVQVMARRRPVVVQSHPAPREQEMEDIPQGTEMRRPEESPPEGSATAEDALAALGMGNG